MAGENNPIDNISIVITGDAADGEQKLDSVISKLKAVEAQAEKASKRFAGIFGANAKSGTLEKTASTLSGILKTVEAINSKSIDIKCDPSKAVAAAKTVQQEFEKLSKQSGAVNVSVDKSAVQKSVQSVQ